MLTEDRLIEVASDLLERWRVAIEVILLDIVEIQLEIFANSAADIDLLDFSNSHCVSDKSDSIDIF